MGSWFTISLLNFVKETGLSGCSDVQVEGLGQRAWVSGSQDLQRVVCLVFGQVFRGLSASLRPKLLNAHSMLGKLWEVKWRLQHRQLAGGKTASRASPWWTQPRSYYRGPTTLSNRSIAKQHPVVVPRPQSRCHFGSETYSIKLKLKAWNLVDLGSEVELGLDCYTVLLLTF